MNKTKIMLYVAAGVSGVLALVGIFLVFSAFTAKTAALEGDDESDGLDTVVSRATQLSKKEVYPCAASVKAIADDVEKLNTWKDEALKLAARGDRAFPPTTAAAFKTFVVGEAKRLQEGFEFGPFKEYVVGGKLPDSAELARLQRQWDDISLVTETLSANGMIKLTALDFAKAAENAQQEEEAKPKKGKKGKKAQKTPDTSFNPSKESYVFTFTITPEGFVKALNAFEICERFVVVENFSFKRQQDVIVAALGGGEKKETQQSGGRRSRRRGQSAPQPAEELEAKNAEAKGAIVTDPQLDPPFVVTLTVSVYDFNSLADQPEEKTEEE